MLDARLLDRLSGMLSRLRRLRFHRGLTLGWLAAGVITGALLLLQATTPLIAILAGVLFSTSWGFWCARPREGDLQAASARIEAEFPELDSRLLTAVEQQPHSSSGVYGYLQMLVLGDVLQHARRQDWRRAVPGSRLWAARMGHLAALTLFVLTSVICTQHRDSLLAVLAPDSQVTAASADVRVQPEWSVAVEPGDVEVERGAGLLVTAAFGNTLPSRVDLVAEGVDGSVLRLPMMKSLNDPKFGARLSSVATDMTYRVEFDGANSTNYEITTFDYPRLEQADARIEFPTYTGLPEEQRPDVRRVSVVEGSTLTLDFLVNKPGLEATFAGEESPLPVSIAAVKDSPNRFAATFTPQRSETYRLQLVDESGRTPKEPVEIMVDVLPNRPPELKFAFPARDLRVSPLEEMSLEGTAWDDFGLQKHGLVLQFPDGNEEELVLGEQAAGQSRATMAHQVHLEPLGVAPDDLVSFYFFADDIGPDGESRRAFSDMFFAEVRHFEETYRQSANQQSQSQQQQQQGGPSQQLLELQREIVSATWNLIRREPLDPPSAKFPEDAQTLVESQQQAQELAEEYAATAEDPILKQHAQEALEFMGAALTQFEATRSGPTTSPLEQARRAARQAYQSLLKLQAREHTVQNSQSPSSQGQSQSQRMNSQLKALELKNDRHRYETEQQARQQQEAAQRESLQVLNRLRELARRQEDLNDRIRQVENELRSARTDAEREELARQLKRLQEEQQEMLRNVDELRERLEQQGNRPEMAEARDALEQTRERVFQSAQALKEQQTSRALAEGTRAQRELDNLKEKFRQQTAGRFDEEIRELREDVRRLDAQQSEIAQALGGEDAATPEAGETRRQRPSLRPSEQTNQGELSEQLNRQRQELVDVLQRMRSLVEASETSEPLLSKRLYDSIRATRTERPEEALSAAAELLRRGFQEPARQAESQARSGITKLREGVEQAAQSVLGDETEALRRAREDLAQLTESIANELAENDRQFARDRQQNARSSGEQPGTAGETSQTAGGDRREGEQSAASGEPSPSTADREGDQSATSSARGTASTSPQEQDSNQTSGGRGRRAESEEVPMPRPAAGDDSSRNAPEETAAGERGRGPGSNDGEVPTSSATQPSGETRSGRRPGEAGNQPPGGSPERGGEPSEGTPMPDAQPGQASQSPTEGQPSPGRQASQEGTPTSRAETSPGGESPSGQGSAASEGGPPASGGGGVRENADQGARQRMLRSFLESDRGGGNSGPMGPVAPLTGEQFVEWSDRMRDVAEMVGDPGLRAELAGIRERAQAMRIEFKRHSKQPNWELVRTSIYGPMRELEQRLTEELIRRSGSDELVPIDRDPVPDQYADLVRRYYEELSRQP